MTDAFPLPLNGALAAAVCWLAIAALALVPARNAFFVRRIAYPAAALVGLGLAAFGLQARRLAPPHTERPLRPGDVKEGDFVTVHCLHEGKRLTALKVIVTGPTEP